MHVSASAWWREVRWPLAVFAPILIVFALYDLDSAIANALFFDAAQQRWLGTHNWWVESFLHTGGRWAIRVVVLLGLALWIAASIDASLRQLRRPAAYFTVAMVLGIGVIGLLKTVTNVDCPWDLLPFGGRYPLIHLFADRPDELRAARCFPAAHASSGYALVALYFVLRERHRGVARATLCMGIACGLVFGIAQQSRGAHFVSHDLWSALLIWLIASAVYVFGFAARVHSSGPVGASDGTMDLVRIPDRPGDGGRDRAALGTAVIDGN